MANDETPSYCRRCQKFVQGDMLQNKKKQTRWEQKGRRRRLWIAEPPEAAHPPKLDENGAKRQTSQHCRVLASLIVGRQKTRQRRRVSPFVAGTTVRRRKNETNRDSAAKHVETLWST